MFNYLLIEVAEIEKLMYDLTFYSVLWKIYFLSYLSKSFEIKNYINTKLIRGFLYTSKYILCKKLFKSSSSKDLILFFYKKSPKQ